MSELNSNVIYENNQVLFSKEVLEYFKSIETEENKEWIEKYFKTISDPLNIIAEKFNIHHIRPCFTFKDENHKNRKETKPFAYKFSQNRIKLSIYNHLFAHYYLWKIYNNHDSKIAFQRMCGQSKYKDNLTENELMKIAKLKEECVKKNQTKEDYKLWRKEYNKNNKEYIKNRSKLYELKNKEYIKIKKQKYNNQICLDPIRNEKCTVASLNKRKRKYKKLYKNIITKECIIDYDYNKFISEQKQLKMKKSKENENKKKEYNKKYHKNYYKKICFDPIKNENCTYSSLVHKKSRNKKLYENINPIDYIVDLNYDEFINYKNSNLKKNNKIHQINKNKIRRNKLCFDPNKTRKLHFRSITK